MVVTAMLAWFDEPPELLREAVESVQGFCDRVVAFDGGYELCPGASWRSPMAQWRVLTDLGVHIREAKLWRGQVEKRNALLQIAAQGSDWVMPLDADWVLRGDKRAAREHLECIFWDVLLVKFTTPANPERSLKETSATPWHTEMVGSQFLPLVYRVLPEMRVIDHHWSYSGLKNGRRVAYWGADGAHAGRDILPRLEIEHRCHFRDQTRIERNRDFCAARDQQVHETGVEA